MASFGRVLPSGVLTLVSLVSGSAAADLAMAKKGGSEYKIVVPQDRSAVIDYTAAELQKYLQEISGVRLG